jgi:hypothetical protein
MSPNFLHLKDTKKTLMINIACYKYHDVLCWIKEKHDIGGQVGEFDDYVHFTS